MKKITVKQVEYVAHDLASAFMEWDEPIPDFKSRFSNVLESCLAVPFQTYAKRDLYKGLIRKASILFYLMIKNHPFENGNKRIAMTSLMYFLYKNNKWIHVDEMEFYNFAKWVTESNPKLKDETIQAVNKFLKTYIVEKK